MPVQTEAREQGGRDGPFGLHGAVHEQNEATLRGRIDRRARQDRPVLDDGAFDVEPAE